MIVGGGGGRNAFFPTYTRLRSSTYLEKLWNFALTKASKHGNLHFLRGR